MAGFWHVLSQPPDRRPGPRRRRVDVALHHRQRAVPKRALDRRHVPAALLRDKSPEGVARGMVSRRAVLVYLGPGERAPPCLAQIEPAEYRHVLAADAACCGLLPDSLGDLLV